MVLTASRDAAKCAVEVKADGCLEKPFDIVELLEVVERNLRLDDHSG